MPMMYRWQIAPRLNAFQIQPGYFESHGLLIELPPCVDVELIARFRCEGDGHILHESTGAECHAFARIDGYTLPERFVGFFCKDTFYRLRRFSSLRLSAFTADGRDLDERSREYWRAWRVLL